MDVQNLLGRSRLSSNLAIAIVACLLAICLRQFLRAYDDVDILLAFQNLQRLDLIRNLSLFKASYSIIMGLQRSKSHFRKLQHFAPDWCPTSITQYESSRSGMRVVVVDQEGPKLHGFFALATEILDDSGAPHTLEHLCFMGSKSYQYKGFLDKLATRAYSGTNAWTATDHTAYTLETAGWAGFRQILPVYLEHVILPTLTDAGCTTEVYHIDGSGNDAGVVYSEMQGVQNTASELMELEAKRLLYPEGVGFRYETGGMMEQLRVLTAERIREFHREMYQPKNLCLVLTGELEHDELLQTLDEFEDSILAYIPSPDSHFPRPWKESKQVPPLKQSTVQTVEFPEEDESTGQIDIRYLGPDVADALEFSALNVVLQYLAGSSAALLDNILVETEQLASGVSFYVSSRPKSEIQFSLSSVKTSKLREVEERFHSVLSEAMSKDIDMSFMEDCLAKYIRGLKFQAEDSAVSFAEPIIMDYLFGDRDGSTLQQMATLDDYTKILSSWSQQQWKDFINKYISEARYVSILGVPSAKLSEKLKSEEAARIEERRKELGPDGLKKKEEELEKAKAENDRPIPSELLAKFEIPSTDSIHFINTASARIGPALKIGRPQNKYQKIVEQDGKDFPLFMNFEHIRSNFAHVNLVISTETIPLNLRPLLSIYMEAFFNLPVKRGESVINFEQVVVELERDTVGYDIDLADQIGNIECIRIAFQVEVEKYDVAIRWLKELMWNSIFDIERLQAVNARLLADVPDLKRSGDNMLTATHLMVHLAPESVGRAKSTLVKALYLKRIKQLLKTDPDQVVQMLESLRNSLGQFENFRVLVIADLEKLTSPVTAWSSFVKDLDTSKPLTPLGRRLERLSEAGKHVGQHSYVVPMPTIDSSYANAIAKGPSSHTDPRLPALLVAISYMNAVEGPLWVAVRGTGLAYGTSMSYDIEAGFLYLDIHRSPEAYRAFEASKKVIEGHMNGEIEFDPLMLEGAISGIVVSFADEQKTSVSAAETSFIREVMRGLPVDYRDKILKKVRDITVDEIKESLRTLVFDVFTPGKADVFVTCAPGLQEGIKTGLEAAGFGPEVHDLTWFQDDYGLVLDGSLDMTDDDDDDDDDDEDDEEDEEGNSSSDFEMVDGDVSGSEEKK